MYRPDYDFQKRRRGSLKVPVIFLGLVLIILFGVLIGFPLGERFDDWWDWSPVPAHEPIETAANAQVPTVAALELVVVTPIPTIAVQSANELSLAPEFVLPDLFDESMARSLVNYSGRPVILNFWASWCVPCKEEMPALQRAYEKYRDEGLVVLGMNQTFVDDLDAARDFVNELALTFPNVRDDIGTTSEGLYQVLGLPTSVFISPDGKIVHKQIGEMTDAQIDTFSRQLAAGEVIIP
jgi:thiol-disulfide isomerase/thioredoxin